jgi:hypothetical protein
VRMVSILGNQSNRTSEFELRGLGGYLCGQRRLVGGDIGGSTAGHSW